MRGQDSNLRPSGYEPDELPDCSTPRHYLTACLLYTAQLNLSRSFFPSMKTKKKAPPRFELGVKVLQTSALPLGYGAINKNRQPPTLPGRLQPSTIGRLCLHMHVCKQTCAVFGMGTCVTHRRIATEMTHKGIEPLLPP